MFTKFIYTSITYIAKTIDYDSFGLSDNIWYYVRMSEFKKKKGNINITFI